MPDERNADFLYAAITDTEGTIRATDTKASIALVLHGLIFNGLITVTKDLGALYDEASICTKVLLVGLLVATTLSSIASVANLLLCVAPAPQSAIPGTGKLRTGLFFPAMRARGLNPRVGAESIDRAQEVLELDETQRQEELAAEVVKLAAIRARKTVLIRRGVLFLGFELALGLSYLVALGVHAG